MFFSRVGGATQRPRPARGLGLVKSELSAQSVGRGAARIHGSMPLHRSAQGLVAQVRLPLAYDLAGA